jgi:hypothetical protein
MWGSGSRGAKTMLMRLSFSAQVMFARRVDDLITFLQRLDPRAYSFRLRVRSIEGRLVKEGENENILIFIIFEKFKVPKMTLETLEMFKSAGFRILVVNNGSERLSSSIKISGADLVINRNNVGKDFGGYKDATLYLYSSNLIHYRKIVYANDSVIYPSRNLPSIIRKLSNDNADFIAHSSVEEIHFHYQSFLFSCGNRLFNSNTIQKFWRSYLPLGRRRYMIRRGEVGFSKAVIRTGCTATVLNSFEGLFNRLRDAKIGTIIELTAGLPTRFRNQRDLAAFDTKLLSEPLNAQAIRMKSSGDEGISAHGRLIADLQREALTLLPSLMARQQLEVLSIGNPTHLGFSYFSEHSDCFVIKRDLTHRGGFNRDWLFSQIRRLYPEEAEQIILMLKPPAGNHYKGLAQVMFSQGII